MGNRFGLKPGVHHQRSTKGYVPSPPFLWVSPDGCNAYNFGDARWPILYPERAWNLNEYLDPERQVLVHNELATLLYCGGM